MALSLLLPLVASSGCDALSVRSYAGAILQFTLEGANQTKTGTHLELWARNENNDIIRVNPFYDENAYKSSFGLMIRQAISLDSPCMTDDAGHPLTTPEAYPTSVSYGGITQTPDEQAVQIQQRIRQLTPVGMPPLLAVVPYDNNPEPVIAATATAEQRKAACDAYRAASDNTYIPNPQQITAPLHGAVYGFVGFQTLQPPTNYDGFRLDTPVSLKGLQEVFMTIEANDNSIDMHPDMRGPLYLTSNRVQGGREVLQFQLVPAQPDGPSGAVAVYVNLDEDPVQF
jgi:hypothetical protein